MPLIKTEQENDDCPEHLWYKFSWASKEKKALKKFFGKKRLTNMVEDHNMKVLYINFESENQLNFNLDSLVSTLVSQINISQPCILLLVQLIWGFNQVFRENVSAERWEKSFLQAMGLKTFQYFFLLNFFFLHRKLLIFKVIFHC